MDISNKFRAKRKNTFIKEVKMKFKVFAFCIMSAFIFSSCIAKQQTVEEKPVLKDIFSVPDGTVLRVTLANNDLNLVVANSPKAKADGLSNKEEIPEDGMIFFFYELDTLSFWMKDMKIPIDIIWIAGDEVVGIEKNVPPPIPHAKLEDLKIYRSNEKADIVVELEAGASDKLGIVPGSLLEMGDRVILNNYSNGEEND